MDVVFFVAFVAFVAFAGLALTFVKEEVKLNPVDATAADCGVEADADAVVDAEGLEPPNEKDDGAGAVALLAPLASLALLASLAGAAPNVKPAILKIKH